jgi:hypothetical protein
MPKIPTFTTQARITAEAPSVISNIQVSPTATMAGALRPLGEAVQDYYINEKKREADLKTLDLLTKSYADQENGKVQGLATIQSELKNNPNPTEAELLYDQKTKSLSEYFKNNYLQNENRFVQKAFENKFSAYIAQGKIDVIQGSRDALDKKELTVVDSALAILDAKYQNNRNAVNPTYNSELESILTSVSNPTLRNATRVLQNQKKSLIDATLDISINPDVFLKKIEKKESYPGLSGKQVLSLIETAQKESKDKKFNILTSNLKDLENKTPLDIINDFNGIKSGTFGGDVNKIKLYNSLTETEKKELIDIAEKERRESNAEINNINTAIKNQSRDESIKNSIRVYDSYKTKGILNKSSINEVFGNVTDEIGLSTKQQFIDLATKQGNNEIKKISNYYKNDEITLKILDGQIKDISTPFVLQGEDKPLSILQRAGDGVNPDVDLKFYIDYLLPNIKDQNFIQDNKKFFNFIKKYQSQIEGPTYSKYVDKNLDNRLNNFKNDMFQKFVERRRLGDSAEELLNKNSKKFIGNNISNYLPTQGEIEKGMLENFKKEEETTYPKKLPNEKPSDYLKRIGLK